jgi:acyl-CoA thioester hydrolase
VRFAEIDAQAVLHNARYLEYFEIGIQEYARATGRYEKVAPAKAIDFHVVKVELHYRKPIGIDDALDIWIRTSRIGATSLTYEMQIHGRGIEELRATAVQVQVRVDRAGGRPVPIDPDQIALIEAFEGRHLR